MIQQWSCEILLVDDNPGDQLLISEALRESKCSTKLIWVKDGVEALSYLNKIGDFKDARMPDLIIMDLNLPKKDGRELLEEIKNTKRYSAIPVIILTSSKAEADIIKCYALHASCYISKPVDLEQYIMMIHTIVKFWCSIVTLPSRLL